MSSFRVEITYLDGVQEAVSDIPTERMAADIYSSAATHDRVLSAVLYGADGCVVSQMVTAVNRTAPHQQTWTGFGSQEAAALALNPLPRQWSVTEGCTSTWYPDGATGIFRRCALLRGHRGPHRKGDIVWDDADEVDGRRPAG